jgi:ribosome biogenesis GTPase
VSLKALGYDAFFEAELAALGRSDVVPARVVRADRGHVVVLGDAGERALVVPGTLLRAGEGAPTTGDWVAVDPARGAVAAVLGRKTCFMRRVAGGRAQAQVVAANADLVFILMGLDGDYNLRRVERYLALVGDWQRRGRAAVAIFLTKAGLVADPEARRREVEEVAPSVPVVAIDVLVGYRAEAPGSLLAPGTTAALLGSSGVGKSTLVNFMSGGEVAPTAVVRARDDRGRHKTTRRELYVLPRGGAVIDTPGMREIQLWSDKPSLDAAFSDVAERALECRFSDCRHAAEPGCAVRAAASRGEIDPSRVVSYVTLLAEIVRTDRDRTDRERRRSRGRRG